MNRTRVVVLSVLIILWCGLHLMSDGAQWLRLPIAIGDALLGCAAIYGSFGRPKTFTPLGARRFSSARFARRALFLCVTLVVVLVAGVAVFSAYRSVLENQMQFINDR